LQISLSGAKKIVPDATLVLLKGAKPEGTNSMAEPKKIVPETTKVSGIAQNFSKDLDPYSVSVYVIQAGK
jgi:alpha-N-arabinofuranosidase